VRIAACVMTHNVYSTMRTQLLMSTWSSLHKAFPSSDLYLFDNRSEDGTADLIIDMPELDNLVGERFSIKDGNGKPGSGRNQLLQRLKGLKVSYDVLVLSDDDMVWSPGSEEKLVELWSHAPQDLAIACGLLEPMWRWNTPRETIQCGKVPVLIRDSAPGAAWTMRYDLVKDRDEPFVNDFGYDYRFCRHLIDNEGMRVGQLDLAEHVGWGMSTHGNNAVDHVASRPLNRKLWGI